MGPSPLENRSGRSRQGRRDPGTYRRASAMRRARDRALVCGCCGRRRKARRRSGGTALSVVLALAFSRTAQAHERSAWRRRRPPRYQTFTRARGRRSDELLAAFTAPRLRDDDAGPRRSGCARNGDGRLERQGRRITHTTGSRRRARMPYAVFSDDASHAPVRGRILARRADSAAIHSGPVPEQSLRSRAADSLPSTSRKKPRGEPTRCWPTLKIVAGKLAS